MRWAMSTAGSVWDAVMLPVDLMEAALEELRDWLMGIFVDPITEDWFGSEDYAQAAEIIARSNPRSEG